MKKYDDRDWLGYLSDKVAKKAKKVVVRKSKTTTVIDKDRLSEVEEVVQRIAKALGATFEVNKSEYGREFVIGYVIHIANAEVDTEMRKLGWRKSRIVKVPGFYVYAVSHNYGNREEPPSDEDVEIYLGDSVHEAVTKLFGAYVAEVIGWQFERLANEAEEKHYAEQK